MAIWKGPGVLILKKGDVKSGNRLARKVIKPEEEFDEKLLDASRLNKLIENGSIDGRKARASRSGNGGE